MLLGLACRRSFAVSGVAVKNTVQLLRPGVCAVASQVGPNEASPRVQVGASARCYAHSSGPAVAGYSYVASWQQPVAYQKICGREALFA